MVVGHINTEIDVDYSCVRSKDGNWTREIDMRDYISSRKLEEEIVQKTLGSSKFLESKLLITYTCRELPTTDSSTRQQSSFNLTNYSSYVSTESYFHLCA